MSKFRTYFGAILRGGVVVLQAVAAVVVPAKFADAATRDDGAHKNAVASDEGMRFQLDARADKALAQSETFVQVAQNRERTTEDVVSDAVNLLADRGVDVGALLQAGALDEAVETLVEAGDVDPADAGGGVDIEDVVGSLDTGDIQEIIASGS